MRQANKNTRANCSESIRSLLRPKYNASSPERIPVRIGIDLDNTIICYDSVFHAAGVDEGLIEPSTPVAKNEVKRRVLTKHSEDAWTKLQGIVYGPRLREAEAYDGVAEFFLQCRRRETPVFIISHKTRYP